MTYDPDHDDVDAQRCVVLCCACAAKASESCDSGDEGTQISDSSFESIVHAPGKSTYHFLRDMWQHMTTTKLKKRYWVSMAHLDDFLTRDRIVSTDIGTWMVLALKLASKYPRGIMLFDLDREKCIVCVPGQAPSSANVNSAMSWMRWTGDSTIGIVLHAFRFACLSVYYNMHADTTQLQMHSKLLIDAAADLSVVDF